MNWLNTIFQNLTVTGNFQFSDGFITNGDGTFSNTPAILYYNGTPAAGNLIFSEAAAPGKDIFNNNYLGGGEASYNNTSLTAIASNGNGVQFFGMTANPGAVFTSNSSIASNTGSNGDILINALNPVLFEVGGNLCSLGVTSIGLLDLTTTADGNTYELGKQFIQSAGGQVINTTSFTVIKTINNVGINVNYRISGFLFLTTNQAANNFAVNFGGTAVAGHARGFERWTKNAVTPAPSALNTIDGATANFFTPAFAAVGEHWLLEVDFFLTFTGAGTVTIQGAMNVAAGGVTINGLQLRLEPYI